jgi:hypothetical protein
MLRAAAMVAAIEGDREQVLASLSDAIDAGLRDDFIFREPAMAPYIEDPEFQALAASLDAILEEEHRNTLQLICFNNPVPEAWQPLPKTCEGVEKAPYSGLLVFIKQSGICHTLDVPHRCSPCGSDAIEQQELAGFL